MFARNCTYLLLRAGLAQAPYVKVKPAASPQMVGSYKPRHHRDRDRLASWQPGKKAVHVRERSMATPTEEKKRKVLIAVDLSSWAEHAFECKLIPYQ